MPITEIKSFEDLRGKGYETKKGIVIRSIEVEISQVDDVHTFDSGKTMQQLYVSDQEDNELPLSLWSPRHQKKYRVLDHLLLEYVTYHTDNQDIPELADGLKGRVKVLEQEKAQEAVMPSASSRRDVDPMQEM